MGLLFLLAAELLQLESFQSGTQALLSVLKTCSEVKDSNCIY